MELPSSPDHELKFSFFCNCKLSVELGEFFCSGLYSGKYFFVGQDRELHAGNDGLEGCGDDGGDGAADEKGADLGRDTEFDFVLDLRSGEEEGISNRFLRGLKEI